MAKLQLEVITPEGIVSSHQVDAATLPTSEGEITVLPGHTPLVGVLRAGMVTLKVEGKEEYLAVDGGFLEVRPDGRLALMADSADRAEDLDLAKIEEAHARATRALEETRNVDAVAAAAALASVQRELARLKVVRHHRRMRRPTLEQ